MRLKALSILMICHSFFYLYMKLTIFSILILLVCWFVYYSIKNTYLGIVKTKKTIFKRTALNDIITLELMEIIWLKTEISKGTNSDFFIYTILLRVQFGNLSHISNIFHDFFSFLGSFFPRICSFFFILLFFTNIFAIQFNPSYSLDLS